MSDAVSPLAQLMAHLPQQGRLDEIWLRPARRAQPEAAQSVEVDPQHGLVGDRYRSRSGAGKRQVTLIQAEHLPVIGALSGNPGLTADRLRRNLVIGGLPLLATRGRQLRIGAEVVLEWTEWCDPCSRMEEVLGSGGYNAMRGMGGICARVVQGGRISVGDAVVAVPLSADSLSAFAG